MFSNDIVGSDAFFEMPSTSQTLYFHLGMRCDDDGFVNPNVTMRMTGANKNDLDILITKRFLLPFKNGVVVIKHHRINNNWDARDCRRTLYTEELKLLFIKDNKSYTLDESKGESVLTHYPKTQKLLPDGNPTGIRRKPADRIEENRIEENKNTKGSLKENTIKLMYNYELVDEAGNPIKKKRLKKITGGENTNLIKVGLLWNKMVADYFKVSQTDVVMKNIYYPIRAVYDRDKFSIDDFKKLFTYFLNDKAIKDDNKMSFDLCMSEKYVAKYKISKRTKDTPKTFVQLSDEIIL